jgi:hypothetical protein
VARKYQAAAPPINAEQGPDWAHYALKIAQLLPGGAASNDKPGQRLTFGEAKKNHSPAWKTDEDEAGRAPQMRAARHSQCPGRSRRANVALVKRWDR